MRINPNSESIKTLNKAGEEAYNLSLKEKVVTGVLTSFFKEPKFYGDNTDELILNIRSLIQSDPQFIINLAIYAREKLFLRTFPQVLIAELAKNKNKLTNRTVQRPDDLLEIFAYYFHAFGKRPIPNALKKLAAKIISKFNEYQLAKYNQQREVRMRDLLCLVHPKPKDKEQSAMWKRVLENRLSPPNTWEVVLSKEGNNKNTWDKLISENHLGYMALLRNLRNIVDSGTTQLDLVLNTIKNKEQVLKSKQLPFRFYSAYITNNDTKVLDAIEEAMEHSLCNVPTLSGKTSVMVDISGSMYHPLSEKSLITYMHVSCILAALLKKKNPDINIIVFSEDAFKVSCSSRTPIIEMTTKFLSQCSPSSIHLFKALKLVENSFNDRWIILSDMQAFGDEITPSDLTPYIHNARKQNPKLWIHSVDLAGYGTSQFYPQSYLNLIAGWSDSILSYIEKVEIGLDSLVKEIEKGE